MNTFIERYKALSEYLSRLLISFLQGPPSLAQFIGRIILFFIIIVAMLVFFAFTGLLEDPTGILIPIR